jgi:nitrite reductase/ring-hydroxylating ferredoxin subunit
MEKKLLSQNLDGKLYAFKDRCGHMNANIKTYDQEIYEVRVEGDSIIKLKL